MGARLVVLALVAALVVPGGGSSFASPARQLVRGSARVAAALTQHRLDVARHRVRMQKRAGVDVADAFLLVDQVDAQNVGDRAERLTLLVILPAHRLAVGLQDRGERLLRSGGEEGPVCSRGSEHGAVVAHRGRSVVPRIEAHRHQPHLVAQSRVLQDPPLDALQNEVRKRTSVDVRTRLVDEAQHDHLVAEKVIKVAGAAGGVEHLTVRRLPERRQLVCARRRRRIAERRPPGRQHLGRRRGLGAVRQARGRGQHHDEE